MSAEDTAPGFWQASQSAFALDEPVDPSRTDLFARFAADPLARHDAELQQLVSSLRGDERLPRYILVTEAGGGLQLAMASRERGVPLRLVTPRVFTDQADAERFVLELRLAKAEPPASSAAIAAELTVVGYPDELSVAPGDTIRFHVSGGTGASTAETYTISIERLLGGGSHRDGPPFASEAVADLGAYPVLRQPVSIGSYGASALDPEVLGELAAGGSASIGCRPTGVVGPATLLEVEGLVRLGLDEAGRAVVTFGDTTVTLAEPLARGAWHRLVAEWTAGGELTLTSASDQGRAPITTAPADNATATLTLGASRVGDALTQNFAGMLESPELCADGGRTVCAWDLSQDLASWTVPGHGSHPAPLTLQGAPRRGVLGADGQRTTALHLYPDGIDDADWEPQAQWVVPAGAASGFYAACLRTTGTAGDDPADWVPFFVRRAPSQAPGRVLVVASTATYAAYSNSRFWWEDPIQEVAQDRLVFLGGHEQHLVTHPEFGLSCYDLHADGTPVVFSSRRRPNLFARPGHARGESYASDLYLIAWLEHLGLDYDVITDEDLHRDGAAALAPYRVVLSGTHPEYVSEPMFDAMRTWVEGGGRYMYLGGNGFTSTVTWHPDRPWLLENRTTGRGRASHQALEHESRHQSDGSPGDLMEASGRAPRTLFGVDSVTMGFDHSYPVARTPESYAPELAFAFDGISGRFLGGRGLSGAGVIGEEWDNARHVTDHSRHHVLARSVDHSLIPAVLGAETPYHGDVVLQFTGAGVVFSASSMAWVGALCVDGWSTDAERFTRNVLLRFLDPKPIAEPAQAPDSDNTKGGSS